MAEVIQAIVILSALWSSMGAIKESVFSAIKDVKLVIEKDAILVKNLILFLLHICSNAVGFVMSRQWNIIMVRHVWRSVRKVLMLILMIWSLANNAENNV